MRTLDVGYEQNMQIRMMPMRRVMVSMMMFHGMIVMMLHGVMMFVHM